MIYIRAIGYLLAVSLLAACRIPSRLAADFPASDSNLSVLRGVVRYADGRPAGDAVVYAYEFFLGDDLPQIKDAFDYRSLPTDNSGNFQLFLPSSRYIFIARKRAEDKKNGQLTPDDFSSAPTLPIKLGIQKTMYKNLTLYSLRGMAEGFSMPRYFDYNRMLYGKVVDEDGFPVPGLVIVASTKKKMAGRFDFSSFPSDYNGEYFLPIKTNNWEGKDTFYVGIREAVFGKACNFMSGNKFTEVDFVADQKYKRRKLAVKKECSHARQ